MEDERLHVLSPFPEEKTRTSKAFARKRNQLVIALADTILIIHAPPTSQISTLAVNAIKHDKKSFCSGCPGK